MKILRRNEVILEYKNNGWDWDTEKFEKSGEYLIDSNTGEILFKIYKNTVSLLTEEYEIEV